MSKTRINIRLLALILSLVLLAAGYSRGQSLGTDPGIPDTISIGSASAFTSGIGIVPLSLYNDEEISAVEITLKHDSPHIQVDSFSFVDGRLEFVAFRGSDVQADGVSITVYAVITSEELLQPGSGLLGHIYYSWSLSTPAHLANIDTITVTLPDLREKSTSLTPVELNPFIPVVVAGELDIQITPFVMDSIWISDTVGYPGQAVTVDINYFNERNVAHTSVSLGFGSGQLQYDSITFENARGATALTKKLEKSNAISQLWLQLSWDEASPLPPGSGVLAHLHFTVSNDSIETLIPIVDDIYLGFGATFINLTSNDGSLQIIPFFIEGMVSIQIPTDVNDSRRDLPNQFELGQNYPNPFNPETTINFSLPSPGQVRLDIFNILGRRVRTIIDQQLTAGNHQVAFDGRSQSGSTLASGVYYYRLSAGDYQASNRMVLLK